MLRRTSGNFSQLCDSDYKQLAKEEYYDSEKYQWKERDWNAPGNIKPHHYAAEPNPPRKPRAAATAQLALSAGG